MVKMSVCAAKLNKIVDTNKKNPKIIWLYTKIMLFLHDYSFNLL